MIEIALDPEPPSACSPKLASANQSTVVEYPLQFIPRPPAPIITKKNHKFPISERSKAFLKQFYPDASIHDWNDWKWQVRNRVRTIEKIQHILQLTEDEYKAIELRTKTYRWPLRRTIYHCSILLTLISRFEKRTCPWAMNLFKRQGKILIL